MEYKSILKRQIKPSEFENEDALEETYIPRYIGDSTAFMKWSTEVEPTPHVVDKDFLQRNRHLVGDINKFLPLSNITSAKSIKLFRLRRNNICLAIEAGLTDVADRTMLANWGDYNTTRGIGGFFQEALITQKRTLEEKVKSEKRGWGRLRTLFKHGEDEEKNMWIMGD